LYFSPSEIPEEKSKYLACTYCGCKEPKKIKETDRIKECFKNDEKKR